MGLFDFFKRDKGEGDDGKPVDKKLASLDKTASNKRAQAYDRDEAIRQLIEIGTPGAAGALLRRFNLKVDPSITDQDEKQLAFEGIVAIGRGERGKRVSDEGKDAKELSTEPLLLADVAELRDAVIEKVREHCVRAENINWAIKVIREMLDDEAYEKALLDLLANFDTEYTRNVEPKVNLLSALEEIVSEQVRLAAEQYLDDVNETVRFHAVETSYKQGNPASLPPMVVMMQCEESVRVKNKVADGLVRLGWTVPPELREDFAAALEDAYEYRMDSSGNVSKA